MDDLLMREARDLRHAIKDFDHAEYASADREIALRLDRYARAAVEAERAPLVEALTPFAEYARALDDGLDTKGLPNAAPVAYAPDRAGSLINVGDLRKARAVAKRGSHEHL